MFTPSQQSELIHAIRITGEIPVKFAYIGVEGANRWGAIARGGLGAEQKTGGIESQIVTQYSDKFFSGIKSGELIDVLDVGCGNGLPAITIMQELERRGNSFRYLPVDVSPELIDIARSNVLSAYPSCSVISTVADIERTPLYALPNGCQRLALLFGTTIGNFANPSKVLTHLSSVMDPEDYLFVGSRLIPEGEPKDIARKLNSEVFRSFLSTTPRALGVNMDETNFDFMWNGHQHQFEVYLRFLKSQTLTAGDQVVSLDAGSSLLLARATRHTENSLTQVLAQGGFKTNLVQTMPGVDYAVALAQPK